MKFGNNDLNNLGDKLKYFFEEISLFIGKYFFYITSVYLIYILYNYYPFLFSVENFTIYFLFSVFLFVLYKLDFFKDFIKSYISTLNIISVYLKDFFQAFLFFSIFLFFIGGYKFSILNGTFLVFYLFFIYDAFVKNDFNKIDLSKKINYKDKKFILLILLINFLLYLFLLRFFILNREYNIYIYTSILIFVYNFFIFYYLTDIRYDIKKLFNPYNNTSKFVLNSNKIGFNIIGFLKSNYIYLSVIILFFGIFLNYSFFSDYINLTRFSYSDIFKNSNNDSKLNTNTGTENINENTTNTGIITSTGELALSGEISDIQTQSGIISGSGLDDQIKKIKIGDYYNFTRYIGIGNVGEDIKIIQNILTKEGYYTGIIDGKFDNDISNLLAKFITDKTGSDIKYIQLGPKAMAIFKDIEITESE